jgi:hypothetical protein
MPGHVRVGGSWKTVASPSVRVGGSWKSVTAGFTRVGGAWKQWYASEQPGNYELIETQILNGTTSSMVFSNLNTYSTRYQHLQIRYTAKSSRVSADPLVISINSTTQSISHHIYGTTTTANDGSAGTSYAALFAIAGTNTASQVFGAGVLEVVDAFETTKNKTIRSFVGAPEEATSMDTAFWPVTAAINTIQLSTFSGTNFANGSRFSIYGLRSVNA